MDAIILLAIICLGIVFAYAWAKCEYLNAMELVCDHGDRDCGGSCL